MEERIWPASGTGSVIGLLTAFNCLAELLADKGIIDRSTLVQMLECKAQELGAANDPMSMEAASILRFASAPLADEQRAALRMLRDRAEGSA